MRWNKVVDLYTVTTTRNAAGDHVEAVSEPVTVFANPRHIGTEAWAAARNLGLHADASIEVRTWEYSGQNRCEMDGVEYEVERSYDTGEYTNLTLKRRLSNA